MKQTSIPMHSSGSSPSAQEECTGAALSLTQDIVPSSQQVGRGHQSTSSGLETKWSADSSEVAVCHSFLSLRGPAMTSSEHLASAERESVTKQPMFLAMDLSTSKDTSPRRKWSPSKDSGGGGGSSSRPMLTRKHLLTKNETSPKRFSPTREMSSLRCLSPGRGMSPCQRMSPRRDASPLRCVSPRLELSPSRHPSPRRELSPRTYLSPERGVSPVRHLSPSREMPSVRYLSLKKMLPPGCAESLSRYPSPGKEDLPCSSKSTADDQVQSSLKVQHGILASMPLPHRFLGKSAELYESKLKIEPRSPACSPGITQPVCSSPLQAPHEVHVHAPSQGEENVFSHLPLHSQQLTRTPYPMIPIGGIQMVQARPSSHPSLVPNSVVSLQTGYFAPGDDGSSSFAEFIQPVARGKEPHESSSVSPVAKVSKYPLSPQLKGSSYLEEKMRTSEHQQTTEQEEYRVKKYTEPSHLEQEGRSAPTDSPSTNYEHSPKPSTSGKEPLEKTGKKQCGSSSTYFESSCTFISAFPTQTLDRSSSTGCLSEPSLSHSHSHQFSVRRRNLSGEPSHHRGTHRKSSPHLERTGFSQTQRQVDENTGST
uniref:Uncharacterized protein n=1 Tax=Pelusios castaneus TaxID=367368 RepID=A0A8C8RBE7_9SAUR